MGRRIGGSHGDIMSKFYIAKQAIGQYNTGDKIPAITDDELQAAIKAKEPITGLTASRVKDFLDAGIIVAADDAESDKMPDDNTGEVVKLDGLSNDELKALLGEEGIDYNKSDNKAALIALFPKD